MTRTVTVNCSLDQFDPGQRQAWEQWLNQHGLDPLRIPLGSTIECDDHERTVTTTYLDADPASESFRPIYDRERRAWPSHTITRQLESAPRPFPSGLTRSDQP